VECNYLNTFKSRKIQKIYPHFSQNCLLVVRRKIGENIGCFLSKMLSVCKKLIITLVFKKNSIFSQQKLGKSLKVMIIMLPPGQELSGAGRGQRPDRSLGLLPGADVSPDQPEAQLWGERCSLAPPLHSFTSLSGL
jgi:hypothetical protein